MQIDSPSTKNSGAALDSAPPRPPDAMSPVAPQDSGIGDMANSPQIMAMQGMALVKDGMQLLANGIPELAQILNNSITQLEQMVTQAMTQSMAGGAPPGMAPPMGPPPPGPGMAPGAGPPGGMPPQPGQNM